ncbi:MAG: ubiquinone biosynthesis accessory factor UbiJ [Betaproteobacteria bacterium]
MIELLVVPAINRVLRRNSWALHELRPFAGRTTRFALPLATCSFTIAETGELYAADSEARPDVTFLITPGQMLRVLARDETVLGAIAVEGDTDFATVVNRVWRQLRWDIEEDLAVLFGDIAAHRMAQTARTLDRWRAQSLDGLAHSFAEYWTEEQPLIARAGDVETFNREVDRLRDDLARLEKRIQQLSPRS